jgi:hypothetical protein
MPDRSLDLFAVDAIPSDSTHNDCLEDRSLCRKPPLFLFFRARITAAEVLRRTWLKDVVNWSVSQPLQV